MLTLTVRAEVQVVLGRDEAREAAREELAKDIYQEAQPGLLARALRWLWDQLSNLVDEATVYSPGGYVGVLAVIAVLVVVAVVVRLKVGPLARAAAAEDPLFLGRPRSSRDHRAAAEAHASAGEWAAAVRERLRAIIRSLEERALLEPRPGRTADEAAREAGLVLPDCAEALHIAAREFDDIWYGGREARPEAYYRLRALDDRVQDTRPVATSAHPGALP